MILTSWQKWVFAWGNPLVSDVKALGSTANAFVSWARSQGLVPVWCCIDANLEKAMANLGWSTVDCIYEDVLHPAHVMQMTSDSNKGKEGQHAVKDLKKNLRRAEKAGVVVSEATGKWTEQMRRDVNDGIERWKKNRAGPQIASVSPSAKFLDLMLNIDRPHSSHSPTSRTAATGLPITKTRLLASSSSRLPANSPTSSKTALLSQMRRAVHPKRSSIVASRLCTRRVKPRPTASQSALASPLQMASSRSPTSPVGKSCH